MDQDYILGLTISFDHIQPVHRQWRWVTPGLVFSSVISEIGNGSAAHNCSVHSDTVFIPNLEVMTLNEPHIDECIYL